MVRPQARDVTAEQEPRLWLHDGEEDETTILLETRPGLVLAHSQRSPFREGPNEDCAAIVTLPGERLVLAVADGMGGAPRGRDAARLALTSLFETLTAAEGETGFRQAILDGLDLANQRIAELGVGAATTIALAEIEGDRLRSYHAGDSAVVVVGQRGKLKHLTLDHSPVAYGVHAGLIDEQDAIAHHERHVISNFLGSPELRIEIGPILRMQPRDTVLLASDGLLDNLPVADTVELIRKGPLPRAATRLAESCRRRMLEPEDQQPSKPDDLTFVLFRRRVRPRSADGS